MQHGESGFESLLQGRNTRSLLSGNANGDGGFVFVELVENEEGDIEAKEEQQHSEQQESLHRPSTQETDRTREAAKPKRAAGLMTYMRDVWGSRANSNQSSAGRNVKMNNVEEPEPLEDTDFSDNEASGYGDHDETEVQLRADLVLGALIHRLATASAISIVINEHNDTPASFHAFVAFIAIVFLFARVPPLSQKAHHCAKCSRTRPSTVAQSTLFAHFFQLKHGTNKYRDPGYIIRRASRFNKARHDPPKARTQDA
ncbi:Hypothetical Protein FCC1311_093962 [Hondaea fermentalgiana]|uniref:Uncharacterized protein n=1 Tax=Hondaea fermentalgiana TaxID=2315210 RepID=A0A2R5GQM0_9STRA|nr:Hypothetical Protein FCC1311_093962 [Hondaea fermentalgiana]|eukprot:GBG33172.1 Hypothetical Protein FCC1311_093962 [Hondaea fermentalgiana]